MYINFHSKILMFLPTQNFARPLVDFIAGYNEQQWHDVYIKVFKTIRELITELSGRRTHIGKINQEFHLLENNAV
jgi:hypothetical protein